MPSPIGWRARRRKRPIAWSKLWSDKCWPASPLRPPKPGGPAPHRRRRTRCCGAWAAAARWAALRGEIEESFARTDALNLDRKQTILGAFFAIERAAG